MHCYQVHSVSNFIVEGGPRRDRIDSRLSSTHKQLRTNVIKWLGTSRITLSFRCISTILLNCIICIAKNFVAHYNQNLYLYILYIL